MGDLHWQRMDVGFLEVRARIVRYEVANIAPPTLLDAGLFACIRATVSARMIENLLPLTYVLAMGRRLQGRLRHLKSDGGRHEALPRSNLCMQDIT
jgi:hypothetical protein